MALEHRRNRENAVSLNDCKLYSLKLRVRCSSKTIDLMDVNLAKGELLKEGRRLVGLTKFEVFGDRQLGSTNKNR